MRLSFSRETLFLILVFAAGEFMGNFFGFHKTLAGYDIVMHFVGGALVSSLIINLLVERLGSYSYITNVFVTLGVGGAWEIIEFLSDTFLGTLTQPSLFDTMKDMIVVLCAAVITNLIYWYRHIKCGIEKGG